MNTEALRNLRTMRQVKSSLEVAKQQKIKATNLLGKEDNASDCPEPPFDRNLEQTLTKEKRRALAYEASIEKSRKRLLKLRDNLATVIRRNRALMDLRRDYQEARWGKTKPEPNLVAQSRQQGKFREVEFKY